MEPRIELIEHRRPDFGPAERPSPFTAAEFEHRIARTRQVMATAGWTHLVVYGDREHFANLYWLTGFDPRFEEALLILPLNGDPLLLVGNECASYVRISPLAASGRLRWECHPPFSLPDQPQPDGRTLAEVFAAEKLGRTGLADWKVLPAGQFATPHWIVAAIQAAAVSLEPATGPLHQLRSQSTAAEIAYFEWTNTLASDGVSRILNAAGRAAEEGWTDFELMAQAGFGGEPQGCHWGLKTAGHRISLASPTGSRVVRGGPLSVNVCYRGANICRAGWVAEGEPELPPDAAGYLDQFVVPYFAACVKWLESLTAGADAGQIAAEVTARLPFERFGLFLNPGHLIHWEEWLGSPFRAGSGERLRAGMILQSDLIPGVPRFFSTRLEDGYALVDAELAGEIGERFPAVAARCRARRAFLAEGLGIHLQPDVWPLSNLAGWLAPFLLRPNQVLAVRR